MARIIPGDGPVQSRSAACPIETTKSRESVQWRGAPSSVFWDADGHPTFLVLLNTRRLVGRKPLHLLLVYDELAVGKSLGPDNLLVANFTPSSV